MKKITKIIKKWVLRALVLALLLIPICALSLLLMFVVPMVFIFVSCPIPVEHAQQIIFAAVALMLFAIYAPDACHWVDKYV